MKKKYIVTLTAEERWMLRQMVSRGKAAARKLVHARILLKADAAEEGPAWEDQAIAEGLEVGTATVERVRRQFVEEGLQAALEWRTPRREYLRELDGEAERRTQTVAEQAVVHSARSERPVCLEDGRRAGSLHATVRPGASGGVSG